MVRRGPCLAGLLLISGWTAAAHATPAACAERLLPSSPGTATGGPAVTSRDLIELRDFGRPDSGPGREPFSISPDGKLAALTLRRADPASDDYCIGVVLVTLDGTAAPRLLDVGGTLVPGTNDVHGIPAILAGTIKTATPLWSPDGKWLAYLRRDGAFTQVWRVGLDGRPARQLTHLSTEALSVAWSADGTKLIYATRRALDAGNAAIDREGKRGFLYDTRFWSLTDARPRPKLPLPVESNALDLASGAERTLSAAEADAMQSRGAPHPAGASLFELSSAGVRAWVAPADPAHPLAQDQLHVEAAGRMLACEGDPCRERIAGLWWRGPRELLILRSGQPTNGGRFALFRWRIGVDKAPRLRFETTDLLLGCHLVRRALLCARESAARPRVLAQVDPDTGRVSTIFDPNPEFARLRTGKVERLSWTDRTGVATYGDLVLPPSHKPGEHHPLIIVQYQSQGFLRGGTGDEYPIFPLAERGYAVLSFQMPTMLPAVEAATDTNSAQRENVKDWAGRRRIFTALEAGIDTAIAQGAIDADRIGISGMSDGSSTVQFALVNSNRFKAAAISSCCDDPGAPFTVGPSYGASAAAWGYPLPGDDGRGFWSAQSFAVNARRLRVPLLMQLPDGEFRMAAEGFAALQSHGAPVEMYVFPDEHHTKTHPEHRLAIYERGMDWFDFWLRGVESRDPERQGELERWRRLRARLGSAPVR